MKTIIEMRYIAIFICMVLAFILLKPWHIGKEIENEAAMLPEQDTLTVAIHDLLSNQYSDLEETKRLDKTIEQFLNQWEIKGASLAIMKNGRLIYSKGYGYANVEDSIPMDVFHIMRVASVSKLITAAGVMKLVENGKLSLQDKVFGKDGILNDSTKYGNIKDKRTRDITVENLLRHQGGFTTRYGDPMFNPTLVAQKMNSSTPATMETMIQFVLSRRLGFTPGTSTSYSNVGYGILSKVIEKVSGQGYEQFIQDSILRPAGCVDMHLGRNTYEERYPNEVKYYEAEGAIPVRACNGADTLVPSSNGGNNIAEFYGAGGWVASPTELLLFLAAIDGDDSQPDILSKESITLMTENVRNALPLGWMDTNIWGDWERSGSMAGTSAMVKRQANGFSWAFLTNTSSWTGPRFPHKIDNMMSKAMNRVEEWPERNLFDMEYCKDLLAHESDSLFFNQTTDNI